jgi:hypothetical protein
MPVPTPDERGISEIFLVNVCDFNLKKSLDRRKYGRRKAASYQELE